MEVVDGLKSTLEEDLEVVIISDTSLDEFFLEEWVIVEQVVDLILGDLAQGCVVGRSNCGGSI